MAVYPSIHGADNPLEAMGLSGRYIWLGGGIVVILFVLAVLLSGVSVNAFVDVGIIVTVCYVLVSALIRINRRYGIHGIMKQQVSGKLPVYVRNNTPVGKLIKSGQP